MEGERLCGFLSSAVKHTALSKTRIFCFKKYVFLLGVVIRSITSCYALIDFINGQSEIVPLKFILPLGGATPCPTLHVSNLPFLKRVKALLCSLHRWCLPVASLWGVAGVGCNE